ncbi:Ctf8p and Ctf18p associating protein [Dispira parvispora]|uniref:Ctf8p and Ctf18p associating protein n=1 Tax=Dispira parvispora TaxID=1520584 RepID=A0A9W8AWC6_9FUNG|nr:Ctf8p and Ctf18p associating protein [Dispira parvispora]
MDPLAEYKLTFASDFPGEATKGRLFELTPELEKWLTQSADIQTDEEPVLELRGLPDDQAVLCTADTSYELRQINTSNSVLVVKMPSGSHNSLDSKLTVVDSLASHVELRAFTPRTHQILELLESTRYRGAEYETLVLEGQTLYTWEQLCTRVQLSNRELKEALFHNQAVLLDGYYRLLDPEYLLSVLQLIFTTVILEDLQVDRIPVRVCVQSLAEHGIPEGVIVQTLRSFSTDSSPRFDVDLDQVVAMDHAQVSRFYALQLLTADKTQRWEKSRFEQVWREAVPEVIDIRWENLKGCVLEEVGVYDQLPYLRYCPAESMHRDAPKCFQQLFQLKDRWGLEEMIPFIEHLAETRKRLDALILKYCRTSKANGQTVYSSRARTY